MQCPYCEVESPVEAVKCAACGEILNKEEYSKHELKYVLEGAIATLRSFAPLTFVGIGAVLLFICLCFTRATYRWWTMLPVAAGALFALSKQLKVVSGFEKKACRTAFWVTLTLLVMRDILFSSHVCRDVG